MFGFQDFRDSKDFRPDFGDVKDFNGFRPGFKEFRSDMTGISAI